MTRAAPRDRRDETARMRPGESNRESVAPLRLSPLQDVTASRRSHSAPKPVRTLAFACFRLVCALHLSRNKQDSLASPQLGPHESQYWQAPPVSLRSTSSTAGGPLRGRNLWSLAGPRQSTIAHAAIHPERLCLSSSVDILRITWGVVHRFSIVDPVTSAPVTPLRNSTTCGQHPTTSRAAHVIHRVFHRCG